MSQNIIRLHGFIKELELAGAWGMAENMRRVLVRELELLRK